MDLAPLIVHHGYLVVFLIVLAEAIDLPVPAALALVGAGAACASHSLHLSGIFAAAIAAMLLGDSLMFFLGRYMGWGLLGLLCKVSINPETCILRSAESFYKRGKRTLAIAKFVPGLNAMAPPLAGSMKMRYDQFLSIDAGGAALYILTYTLLGFIFRDFVATITRGFHTAGHAVGMAVLIALGIYVTYRVWLYQKHRIFRVVPRIQVEELARRLASEEAGNVQVVDVRSHGYYDSDAQRIKGSIRLEPNHLGEELKNLPKDKHIYVYCT
ncbi:MAG: VTT domain-containing protein [Acidobacteria bacterium]|nr:VTT domain-containing protein [Acidobacteriota bacterium]